MDEPLQKSLERYDVLDRIAVGGMAEVFLAKAYGAHGFEKTIAIKRILPELARDPEFEARFIAEAKVAVRLSHANVVQVLDFGRIGESLFIAMEFVDGLDLAAFLRKFKDEGRLVPLPAAFHIAIEIIRALDFAHGHNVVHRDVSPSNILISRAGEVKIADFGIAVAAQPHRGGGPGPRKVMGKWRYMSPEQARGDTLDTRSDLFSAAAVIFELFTGDKLFPGDESDEIIRNIETMHIPKLAALRPGLPSRLDELIAGPLARKPIDRPLRPASVLRQLIELSYESSIMATALDVADAVASVLPARRASGAGALDDVIRKQLGDQSVARQTAVTDGKPPATATAERQGEHSTGLFRMVDGDGLARLEEVEPTAVAGPRGRRTSDQPFVMPGDVGEPDLFEPAGDRDRRTEVGAPPTGPVPMAELAPPGGSDVRAAAGGGPTAGSHLGRRRMLTRVLAVLALVGAGLISWVLLRDRTEPARVVTPAVVADAPVAAELLGTLEVDSIPPGALVTIADRVQGAAPRSARVTANTAVRVKLELAGYQPYEGDYRVKPNTIVVVREKLVPAPAELVLETTPPGAQVTLAGAVLGTTPLTRAVPAQTGARLVFTRPGFERLELAIELIAGRTTTIRRELKPAQRYGTVTFEVTGTALWADVAVRGRSLGRTRTASGLVAHRLPVGRTSVRLTTGTGQTKTLDVTVTEGAQIVRVTFD